ncbi:MAG: murein biosynthesis integral membrane protein MurJ [Clostridiales bacterium]|nr:murein biosynthesis integral membrane protein MurJ [Clostridiales bacterium]
MHTKKTVNTVLLVIYLTIFSKFFGLLRDILIGSHYGTSVESDAYFAAYRMTITIFLSIGTAITAITIPFIVKYIKQNKNKLYDGFINNIITVVTILTIILASIGVLLAPYYTKMIAIGFSGEKLALTVNIVRVFIPVLILVPLVYILISILQSNDKFSITSIISIPYNAVLIFYLIVLNTKFGIMGLAFATLFGWAGQLLLLLLFTKKEYLHYKPKIDMHDDDLKMFFKLIGPILMSSAVYNINVLVDSSIASTLVDGQLAALNFANIAYTAIATTSIFGISTVLFPQFAALIAENKFDELRRKITSAIGVMIFIFTPVVFGILAINKELIQVLYQRGTFDLSSVSLTSAALIFYSIGMIGFAVQELSNKVFYAMKNTKTPFITSSISVAINIVLNLLFVKVLGIRGLALATSIAVTFNGVIMVALIQRKIGRLQLKEIAIKFVKVLIVSILMAITVSGANYFLANILLVYIRLPLVVVLGVIVYYLVSEKLHFEEIYYIKEEIFSRLKSNNKGA